MFKSREMHKTYYAVVRNKPQPEAGNLVHWLVKNPQKNVTKAHDREVTGSMRSELNYKLVGELNGYYLIEVDPITGRPHQIRVQLSLWAALLLAIINTAIRAAACVKVFACMPADCNLSIL
jgi:23S rRNA pseudouridine1911/1915/1917 synthase